jgi:single-stranded-DNA-specific exonuclease
MHKRWKILEANEANIITLQESLKINKTLCKILVQRGFEDYEKAKAFFYSLNELHDPWLMKDMDKAVTRLTSAFSSNEKF